MDAVSERIAAAHALVKAREMKTGTILVNLSGRGDRDMDDVIEHWGTGAPKKPDPRERPRTSVRASTLRTVPTGS